jgi:hypothetical protein
MNANKDDDWYSMEYKSEDKEDKNKDNKDNKDNKEDKNKDKNEIHDKVKELETKILSIERHLEKMESLVHTLTNENLKMTNRVLEAEIALERAKNSLVRNHIPFPFSTSPISNRFRL